MRLRVAAMPAGEDPAEMMAADGGAERFRALLDGAEELTAFQVRLVLGRTDVSSPMERDRALAEVAPVLAGMGETVSREEFVRKVADQLDLEPAMVMGRVVAATPATGGREEAAPERREAPQQSGPRRPAELTSRERRERALLAMCIAIPSEGREYLARLTEAHLSPTGLRVAAWLREHPDDPASNLPHDDGELAGLIAELVIMSREEPASHEAMELNFLLLDQRRIEGEIAAAGERGDYERRAALSRERAALVERIAHAERPAGSI
jgi:DNA primase